MAASVNPKPAQPPKTWPVVDAFAKFAASGKPIPDVGKVPLSEKGKTLPSALVTHIFSFALPKVQANFSATCRAAYLHLKTTLSEREILDAIGDQSKHYPIRAVVQKIAAYVKLCPNLRTLNCRDLVLSNDNRASRDLIPSLMRAWPRELHRVFVPYRTGGDDVNEKSKSFVSDLMEGIYQALPLSVQHLDLRVHLPTQVREHQAIASLKIEQIDCSKISSLAFCERSRTTSAVFTVFPRLRHLTVALQLADQFPLISQLIRDGKDLQTLKIVNESGDRDYLQLCTEGALITAAQNSGLQRVEIDSCLVNKTVVQFFKNVSRNLEVRFTDCRMDIPRASFTFSPQALQDFT